MGLGGDVGVVDEADLVCVGVGVCARACMPVFVCVRTGGRKCVFRLTEVRDAMACPCEIKSPAQATPTHKRSRMRTQTPKA